MKELPAWIQAIAAVIQAAAAITIYRVTKQYVMLTRELAEAASEQLQVTRLSQLANDKMRAVALRERATSLEKRVSALPNGPDDTALRGATLWTSDEVEQLRTTAAATLELAATPASNAADALAWIFDRIQAVRATSVATGYDYRQFPAEQWAERRRETLAAMRELIGYADVAQGLAEKSAKQLAATHSSEAG